jgi:hypothetical protein
MQSYCLQNRKIYTSMANIVPVKGNTAQRASGDFARHLPANFPSEPVSYLPARILRAYFPFISQKI